MKVYPHYCKQNLLHSKGMLTNCLSNTLRCGEEKKNYCIFTDEKLFIQEQAVAPIAPYGAPSLNPYHIIGLGTHKKLN